MFSVDVAMMSMYALCLFLFVNLVLFVLVRHFIDIIDASDYL